MSELSGPKEDGTVPVAWLRRRLGLAGIRPDTIEAIIEDAIAQSNRTDFLSIPVPDTLPDDL